MSADLDPLTKHYLARGAELDSTTEDDFMDCCIDEFMMYHPELIDRAVQEYVQGRIRDMPNLAEHFELR